MIPGELINQKKMKMKDKKLIPRLLVSPFVLGILVVSYTYGCIKHWIGFIKYGGEWMTYAKDDTKRMEEIYKLFKEQYSK